MPRLPARALLGHLCQLVGAQLDDRTDRELLRSFLCRRDESAFAVLLQRHAPLVWRVCRRALGHQQDAEDAFQAAFLVLAQQAASIRTMETVGGWLHGVACRTAMNAKRSRMRRQRHEQQAGKLRQDRAMAPQQSEAALREMQVLLDEEVDRLPVKYRAPFVLCCLEGRSRAEAARELGWKEGTVSSRIAQAREQLRQRLLRRGVTLSAALTAGVLLDQSASACVPSALVQLTLKAESLAASGQAVASVAGPSVAALVDAGIKAVAMTKAKIAVAVLLAMSLAGSIGLAVGFRPQVEQAAETQTKTGGDKAKDVHDDPLPPGATARMGSTRFRHSGLSDFVFLDGGKIILTSGSDRVLRFWGAVDGKLKRTVELQGSAGPGRVITLSPDGRTMAAQEGGNIVLWDSATGKEIKTLPGPKSQLGYLYFSPDGKTLAVGRGDLQVSLWDWQNDKERSFRLPFTREMFQGLDSSFHGSFSPDGKWFVAGASLWEPLGIFEVATGREVHRLTCFPFHSRVSPDSKRVAVTGWKDDKGKEAVIRVFDVAGGKETAQFPIHTTYHSFAFSPDGKTLACGFSDESCVLDLTTGRVSYRLSGRPIGMEFSPDGKSLVASSGHRLRFWDARTGKELHDDPADFGYQPVLAVSPNGRLLAAADWMEQEVRLWDAASGRLIHRLPLTMSDKRYVLNVAFSPKGRTVMAHEPMGFVQYWDVSGGKTIRTDRILDPNLPDDDHSRYQRFHVSSDGKQVATLERIWSRPESTRIGLWETGTGKLLHKRSFPGRIQNAVWTSDGTIAVLPLDDGLTAVDIVSGAVRLPVTDAVGDGRFRLSPDDRLLVAPLEKCKTGEIGVWEMATGKEVARIAAGRVDHLALVADDRTLVTTDDQYLHVWDLADGKERLRQQLPLKGIDSWGKTCVYALTLSPDGRRAFTAMSDGTCLVWDLKVDRRTTDGLGAGEFAALWTELASDDAAKAFQALWRLADAPGESVRLLRQHLKPTVVEDPQKIRRLIADLDDDEFAVREAAQKALAKLDAAAEPVLREALDNNPSPEARRRIEGLLSNSTSRALDPEMLRRLRAVQVLEQMAAPEARELLQTLANGAAGDRVTRLAKAALQRLNR